MTTQDRNRVQRGVPTGGQFATEARSEPADLLSHATGDFWADHQRIITDEVPTMGRASADFNYHRATYSGDQVSVTMPSRAAIMRYVEQNGDEVRIPLTASHKGLPDVAGWAVARRTPTGQWNVTVEGTPADGRAGSLISESVASVLEARRARSPLPEIGEMLKRNREVRRSQVEMVPLKSSWMDAIGYVPDPDKTDAKGKTIKSGILIVRSVTRTKGIRAGVKAGNRYYGWRSDPYTTAAIRDSESPGRMYDRLVRGKLEKVELEECGICGNPFEVGTAHRCAV